MNRNTKNANSGFLKTTKKFCFEIRPFVKKYEKHFRTDEQKYKKTRTAVFVVNKEIYTNNKLNIRKEDFNENLSYQCRKLLH